MVYYSRVYRIRRLVIYLLVFTGKRWIIVEKFEVISNIRILILSILYLTFNNTTLVCNSKGFLPWFGPSSLSKLFIQNVRELNILPSSGEVKTIFLFYRNWDSNLRTFDLCSGLDY